MVEVEITKKNEGEKRKNGADVVVDGNTCATFTKEHHAKPGEPYLAPPGVHTSVAQQAEKDQAK